jgi:hypothetical protein
LSTRAQLDRAHQTALQGLQNVLAARGMLQSGSLGVGLGLESQRDKAEQTKAVSSLIDYLTGQAQAYAEHLHQSKLQEAQAIQDTTMAYMQLYAGSLGGGSSQSGPNSSDWAYQLQGRNQGYDPNDVYAKAAAQAPSYGGVTFDPHMIMNEGQVFTDANGKQYVNVKYSSPGQGSSTEKVYLGG